MATKTITLDEEAFEKAVRGLAREEISTKKPKRKAKRKEKKEYSKIAMDFSRLFYALTWAIAVISWFWFRDIPSELLTFGTAAIAVAQVSYSAKAGYENGKIFENNYDPNYQGGDWQDGL